MEAIKYKAHPLFFLTQNLRLSRPEKSFLPTKVLVSYIMTYINNIKAQSYTVTLITLFIDCTDKSLHIKLQDAFNVIQLDLIELKLLLNSTKGKSMEFFSNNSKSSSLDEFKIRILQENTI